MATLPFKSIAQLREQNGTVVVGAETVPCSVWPAVASRSGERGRHHTHRGEADVRYASALQVPNRTLVVDGVSYRITAATVHDLVPHVALELNRTSGAS